MTDGGCVPNILDISVCVCACVRVSAYNDDSPSVDMTTVMKPQVWHHGQS